jgi:glutamate dehydrogenase
MEDHRLKREIIATAVTNSMVNRMGATFTLRMTEDTGRSAAEVAEAYTIAREALDARALWAQIDALDGKVAEEAQIDALQAIWLLLRSMSRWLLGRPGAMPEIAPAVARFAPGLEAIRAALPGILSGNHRAAYDRRLKAWRERGMPPTLAAQLAGLPLLDAGCDIVEVAIDRKLDPARVAQVYYAFGDALHVPWLIEQIDALPVEGRWHAHARGVLRDELRLQQRTLVGHVIAAGGKAPPDQQVADWMEREDPALRFTQAMFAELRAQKALDYPTVSVAVRRLAQMAAEAGS